MRHSSKSRKLNLQALEERTTPTVGTFVEDFTNDANARMIGYDSAADGVRIAPYMAETYGQRFQPTPKGGPTGNSSLYLRPGRLAPVAQYFAMVGHSTRAGDLPPWESVTAASITVRGSGTIQFNGEGSLTITHTGPEDHWVTYSVTSDTLGAGDQRLGRISSFRVSTTTGIFIDDVTVSVDFDLYRTDQEASNVRVTRFGNGVGIVGDRFNNFVQLVIPDDPDGTIRVLGLNGTKIDARSAGVTQISPTEVAIADFSSTKETEDGRDILVNLNAGDDRFIITGSPNRPAHWVDDVMINMGGGESLVEVANFWSRDLLSVSTGDQVDHIFMNGSIEAQALILETRGGNDEVQIGAPGSRVFSGESPGPIAIYGRLNEESRIYFPSRIDVGAGNDTVQLAGGDFRRMEIIMGAGDDQLKMESAYGLRLRVRPGSGIDLVTFRECLIGPVETLLSDFNDVLRLDRVRLQDAGENYVDMIHLTNAPTRIGRCTIELPSAGTVLQAFRAYEFNPDDPTDELMFKLQHIITHDSLPRLASLRFAEVDF